MFEPSHSAWTLAALRMQRAGVSELRFDGTEVAFGVGEIQVRVRPDGPNVLAAYRWPRLGLGIQVDERDPADAPQDLPGIDPALLERFTLRAHNAVQLAHFFDDALGHALAAFDRVRLDDSTAEGEQHDVPARATGVERCLYRAYELAKRVYASRARVAPTLDLVGPPSSRVPPYR